MPIGMAVLDGDFRIIVTEKGEAIMPYNRTKKLTTVE